MLVLVSAVACSSSGSPSDAIRAGQSAPMAQSAPAARSTGPSLPGPGASGHDLSYPPSRRSTGTSAAGTPPAGPSKPAAAASGGGCAAIKASTLEAVFTVPVGAPYQGGTGDCWFGIGPNATATGSVVETLSSDSFLAQLFPASGPDQYEFFSSTKRSTPLPGVDDKASYSANGVDVYVLKGDKFCLVQLILGNSSELGLPADPGGTVPDADASKVATKLSTICDDFFAAAG